MHTFRQTSELAIHFRRCFIQNHSLIARHNRINHKLPISNLSVPRCPNTAQHFIGNIVHRCPIRTYCQRKVTTASIKEQIYDKLILFTRMLQTQSHVYISLRIRRFGQLFRLYQRLYSPREFQNVFINNFLHKLKLWSSSQFKFLSRHKFLLSFASCAMFSWEDNRISDQEFNELIKEFTSFEKSSLNTNERMEITKDQKGDFDLWSNEAAPNDGGFMVVNCMQSSKKMLENWEVVINRPDFHVWRKSVNNTALYEYKVFGSFSDISAYSFFSVQRDLEFRKEWDKLVLKLDVIDVEPGSCLPKTNSHVDDSGNELIHWVMKYPYPMKSREYLYIRRSRIYYDKKFIILISRSVPYQEIDESSQHVRVYNYMSQMVIKPHRESFYECGFDYMLTYFDDPRASFPSPAYNWMASRGVPDFVEKLHNAALKLSLTKHKDLQLTMPIVSQKNQEEPTMPIENSSDKRSKIINFLDFKITLKDRKIYFEKMNKKKLSDNNDDCEVNDYRLNLPQSTISKDSNNTSKSGNNTKGGCEGNGASQSNSNNSSKPESKFESISIIW